MRKRSQVFVGLAVSACLAAAACSDAVAPTAVRSSVPSNDKLLGGLLDDVTGTLTSLLVSPLRRSTPLAQDVTWTFTAGPGGGSSANGDVGLAIVIPPGALSSTQTFTVTAQAGSAIAYSFAPHTVFSRKVYLTQNLRGTTSGLLSFGSLIGAHFDTDRLELDGSGLATVTETVPALTSLFTRTVSFGVGHFSGWIVASGRDGDAF